jgi:cell division transport system ATP-binding protein
LIQFFNVSKKYRSGPVALGDVSFAIARGEFVFLTGPSGAGKTTLLKLVYREELPDSGQIVVNGRNVTALPRRKIPYLRRSIGVVFQSFRLIPRKTVFENVTYLPRILGMSSAEQQRMCERALRRVGLAHRLNAYPRQLSGGEQQRVTLARALVCDPRIILADEPTGNLDPELSAEILALLREIHAQGTTVIVATHDRAIIESLGGRVMLLHRGRLVADGHREPGAVEPPPYAAAAAAAVAAASASSATAATPPALEAGPPPRSLAVDSRRAR